MEISALVFVLVIVMVIVISVRERIRLHSMRDKNWDAIGEARSSPLSRAITGMVGTAGGIYLSLILMQTFLELEIPNSLQVSGVSLEPLAALSIALAVIQPFVMRLWLRKR